MTSSCGPWEYIYDLHRIQSSYIPTITPSQPSELFTLHSPQLVFSVERGRDWEYPGHLINRTCDLTEWSEQLIYMHAEKWHYNDVIMGAIGSQITSLTIVYPIVYSDADQWKHQSSASLAFVWGNHRGPVNSPHKWPITRKMFPFDDVIMDMLHVMEKLTVSVILEIFTSCNWKTPGVPNPLEFLRPTSWLTYICMLFIDELKCPSLGLS